MRYDVEPLLRLTGLSWSQLRRRVGVSGNDYQRVRDEGFTDHVADRAATVCGFHPFEVWPEMAEHRIEQQKRTCRDCGAPFVPPTSWTVYCSATCRKRVSSRNNKRRQRRNPLYRRREAEKARQYRRENARAIAISRRVYDETHREQRRERQRAYYRENREEMIRKQRIRDHYKRGHDTRPSGCPAGCPLNVENVDKGGYYRTRAAGRRAAA